MAGAKGSRYWQWRVFLAFVQSLVYLVALRNVPWPARPWCTHRYRVLDCNGKLGRAAVSNTTSGLKVVLPSVGQTGTTSVINALREIGLRAYHADDFSIMARMLMMDRIPATVVAKTVSRCRMEAISLEPVNDLLSPILETSPEAKFVLTWRSYQSVKKSNGGFQRRQLFWPPVARTLVRSNHILPWIETFDTFTGLIQAARLEGAHYHSGTNKISAYMYKMACNGYGLPRQNLKTRGIWKIAHSEEAYLGHINEIRTLVPPDRLLEFDIKRHGWYELEGFLGVESERSAKRMSLPRMRNSEQQWTNEALMENNPEIALPVLYVLACLHGANFCLVALAVHLLLLPVFLCWPSVKGGGRRRVRSALERSPLVPTLDGLSASENLAAGKALAEAGIRMIAVSLRGPEPLRSIRLLSQALPQDVLVGAGDVGIRGTARRIKAEGGAFMISTHVDEKLVREAKVQGLVCVAGACTASEASAARSFGADAVAAFPGETVSADRIRALRRALPPTFFLLASPPALPKREALAELKAAGIDAFGTTFGATETAKAPDKVAARARELLASFGAS